MEFFAANNNDCVVSSVESEINVIFSIGHVRLGVIFSFFGNDDAYILLHQILIGCLLLSQEFCELIG